MREKSISKYNIDSNLQSSGRYHSRTGVASARRYGGGAPRSLGRNLRSVLEWHHPRAYRPISIGQFSKSTSSKKMRTKRDMVSRLPYSEFPATTGTFTGLAISLLLGLFGTVNTYASSINIAIPSGSTVLNTLNDGSFSESSVNASALVWTDNYTGYNLTIMGGNSTGVLEGTKGGTIPTIETEVTPTQFASDATLMNKWGFKPSKLYKSGTTIDNSNYIKSPTSDESVIIDNTKVANDENHKNAYALALAAKVDGNTALDSYTQTFTLAATSNATPYHIAYTDDVQNMPAMTVGEIDGTSIPISTQKPFKNGYVFMGWCSEPTTDGTCSGAKYDPGDSYTLNPTTDNSVTLHAMWAKGYDTFEAAFIAAGKKDTDKTNGHFRMQDITPEICNSIVIGSPYTTADIAKNTLIDTRNNKTYLVAKYADGHCWMRENLNYVFTAGGTVVAYNFQTGETFNYTTPLATQTSTGTAWPRDASDGPRSFQQNKDNCIGGTDINTSGGTGVTCDANKPYERIGVLYNWAAATAQTGAQAAAAGSSGDQVIPTSICPKGWRLPANEGDYSFSTLMGSYGLPTTNQGGLTSANNYSGQLQNPLNFNRPGDYLQSNGALLFRGTGGYFWSSVGSSATSAHHLDSHSETFNPQGGDYKGYGFSVRCVAV